ncbi:MAG: hypothetical protein NVS4B10_10370 [Myxococcales bacterium]
MPGEVAHRELVEERVEEARVARGASAQLLDDVDAAAAAGRAALRPGVGTRETDGAAREVITDAGYGEHFVHPVGHGVGLVIHEAPAMGSTATATLEEGMTVTVEPGVYLPGRGGVRIEDTLVVTGSGAEPLTASTRDLLVLG